MCCGVAAGWWRPRCFFSATASFLGTRRQGLVVDDKACLIPRVARDMCLQRPRFCVVDHRLQLNKVRHRPTYEEGSEERKRKDDVAHESKCLSLGLLAQTRLAGCLYKLRSHPLIQTGTSISPLFSHHRNASLFPGQHPMSTTHGVDFVDLEFSFARAFLWWRSISPSTLLTASKVSQKSNIRAIQDVQSCKTC